MKEKKLDHPCSIKFEPATKAAIDKACHKEDRTISNIVNRAIKKYFGLK